MKFSDAISSIWPRCRSSSWPSSCGDLGVDLVETRAREVLEGFLRDGHRSNLLVRGCRLMLRQRSDDAGQSPRRRTRRPRGRRAARRRVKSSTVEGVPGSSPASTTAPTPRGSRGARRRAGADRGRRRAFALVAATAPTTASTRAVSSGSSGTRTPIANGFAPVSQRNRRAGLGRISVYGPGSSARAIVPARPRSSGTHSRSVSRSAASSAVGLARLPALQPGHALARGRVGRASRRARRPCRSAGSPAFRRGARRRPDRRRSVIVSPPPLARVRRDRA